MISVSQSYSSYFRKLLAFNDILSCVQKCLFGQKREICLNIIIFKNNELKYFLSFYHF